MEDVNNEDLTPSEKGTLEEDRIEKEKVYQERYGEALSQHEREEQERLKKLQAEIAQPMQPDQEDSKQSSEPQTKPTDSKP